MSETSCSRSSGESSHSQLSEAQEDYLKQIFLLGGGRTRVTTQALAGRLAVRPPSVTEMVRRLAQLGLAVHEPYRGVRLTERGRRIALEMLRHHRLLETFLVRFLGYGWDEVHEEAERLEHVISERFEERIAETMGHPTRDPHGDPIPASDLTMPDGGNRVALAELAPGARGVLVTVGLQDPENLERLRRLGLLPGAAVELVDVDNREFMVRVDDEQRRVPAGLARELWIEGA